MKRTVASLVLRDIFLFVADNCPHRGPVKHRPHNLSTSDLMQHNPAQLHCH